MLNDDRKRQYVPGAAVWMDRCACGKWKAERSPRCKSCAARVRAHARWGNWPVDPRHYDEREQPGA